MCLLRWKSIHCLIWDLLKFFKNVRFNLMTICAASLRDFLILYLLKWNLLSREPESLRFRLYEDYWTKGAKIWCKLKWSDKRTIPAWAGWSSYWRSDIFMFSVQHRWAAGSFWKSLNLDLVIRVKNSVITSSEKYIKLCYNAGHSHHTHSELQISPEQLQEDLNFLSMETNYCRFLFSFSSFWGSTPGWFSSALTAIKSLQLIRKQRLGLSLFFLNSLVELQRFLLWLPAALDLKLCCCLQKTIKPSDFTTKPSAVRHFHDVAVPQWVCDHGTR